VLRSPQLRLRCWPDGIDLAPEPLYEQAKARPLSCGGWRGPSSSGCGPTPRHSHDTVAASQLLTGGQMSHEREEGSMRAAGGYGTGRWFGDHVPVEHRRLQFQSTVSFTVFA
jgi:hypothetical protein